LKTLQAVEEIFDNPPTAVAKELTKLHGEFVRGETTREVMEFFEKYPDKVRGEFVVLFRPRGGEKREFNLKEEVEKLKKLGMSAKDIYKTLKGKGFEVDRREVYKVYGET